jgi:hypothetical protein
MPHADTSAHVQQLPRALLSAISTVPITSTFLRDAVRYAPSFAAERADPVDNAIEAD